ncbi:Methionine ABC transporter ATP-binding protein [Streptococcus oralis]|uniref:Methionine ABC transporter ATP-binding protein n=1 Tax=Streptococcus oralis TaxID=1303 RepID=A0A139RPD5_STROR|nr:ATP-binding cassette domain-containing protein [Streptococcus oralis]KXU16569.1 Methionine ABC transporter ATP-binding protein [Streptococcus oralis]
MISLTNVTKIFKTKNQQVTALDSVSLEIEKGDIYGIIGYSGAGKSTLLRTVNGLEKPEKGQVKVDGKLLNDLSEKELNDLRKNIGMVFQHFSLLESRTVSQNIALPLVLSKKDKNFIKLRVNELLDFVGLSDKKDVPVNKLSGGQKQRVGIARALATQPDILLCDEATSALDPKTTLSILQLLKKINQEFGITILLITHEMEVVKEICNKMAVMEDGKIVEHGNVVDLFTAPHEKLTKSFIHTVINHKIPDEIVERLDKRFPVYRFTFLGVNADQDLLSRINKQYDVSTRILSASVNEVGQTILGILYIQIEGDESEIEKVEIYARQHEVVIERVSDDTRVVAN